jgi:hypothetical protein
MSRERAASSCFGPVTEAAAELERFGSAKNRYRHLAG